MNVDACASDGPSTTATVLLAVCGRGSRKASRAARRFVHCGCGPPVGPWHSSCSSGARNRLFRAVTRTPPPGTAARTSWSWELAQAYVGSLPGRPWLSSVPEVASVRRVHAAFHRSRIPASEKKDLVADSSMGTLAVVRAYRCERCVAASQRAECGSK